MEIETADFNGADELVGPTGPFSAQWQALESVLYAMPLQLKASDENKKQGTPIFNPIGTNDYIKVELTKRGWQHGIPIPSDYAFLGTDVDFGANGLIVEAQFSNYPFLLNNVLRSELFFKSKTPFAGKPTGLVCIVTKAKMFPASQSTLYYEQAKNQVTALAKHKVFQVPLRLIGLFVGLDEPVPVQWTTYAEARYSRTVSKIETREYRFLSGCTSQ